MGARADLEPFYHDAQVCVTGATGFLGGHLVRRMLSIGARVTVFVRSPAKLPPDIAQAVDIVQGDLMNTQAIEHALGRAEYIFHCAANVATWDRPEAYDLANVVGVKNLLAAIPKPAQGRLKRLIHVSTMDVYGFPDAPAVETAPTPINDFAYSESKRVGESLLCAYCVDWAIPFTVIRPGNIIGPGSPFISRIGKELVSGLMLKINGGGVHAGLIDVDNLIDILLWSGVSSAAHNKIFNARDSNNVTWSEFLGDFRDRLAGKGIILNLSYRPAMMVARLIGGVHSTFRLPGEPLLHPLIVNIFGKTCGHTIDRLQACGAPLGGVEYHDSLDRSVAWFVAGKGEKPGYV